MGLRKDSNIVLIGMPGSGKSTVGILLAKESARPFVDTDILLQTTEGRSLQAILDAEGYMSLRHIEEKVLLSMQVKRHIIATGGSAAYSAAAMAHLSQTSQIVFLDVDIPTLEKRLRNFATRGIACSPEQTFTELFHERFALYSRYADIRLECSTLHQEEIVEKLMAYASPEDFHGEPTSANHIPK